MKTFRLYLNWHWINLVFCLYSLSAAYGISAPDNGPGFQDSHALVQYGKPFPIHYRPAAQQFDLMLKTPVGMNLLLYRTLYGEPETIPMEKQDGLWRTIITVRDTSIKMILFAFQGTDSLSLRSKSLIKDNQGQYWDLLLHDETGQPVRGANLARAMSYTGIGGIRQEDLERAFNDVIQELKLYPDHFQARTLLYTLTLRLNNFSKGARREIQKDIERQLEDNPDNLKVLQFALESYRMINERNEAKKIEEKLVRLDSRGDQAALNALNKIMQSQDAENRATQLEQFIEDYAQTRWTEFALSSLASTAIELGDTTRMLSVGDRLHRKASSPAAASALAAIAGVFIEKSVRHDRSVAYATDALTLVRTAKNAQQAPDMTRKEWTDQLQKTEARYQLLLGRAYMQQGKTDRAIAEIEAAVELSPQADTYFHLAESLKQSGSIDAALVAYARSAAFGGETGDAAYEAFSEMWTMSQRPPDGMTPFYDKEVSFIESRLFDAVLSKRSISRATDFELEDISAGWVRLSDQKGTVVLVCFWATWSQSSNLLLKELELLADIYGNDVLFLTIATDITFKSVEQYVKKNKFNLTVLLNDGTDYDYGITGVPTLFVIDGSMNIHFTHKGYQPDIRDVLSIELDDLLKTRDQ